MTAYTLNPKPSLSSPECVFQRQTLHMSVCTGTDPIYALGQSLHMPLTHSPLICFETSGCVFKGIHEQLKLVV